MKYRAFWVSTGMFPQQISIVFKEKWIIRQVRALYYIYGIANYYQK